MGDELPGKQGNPENDGQKLGSSPPTFLGPHVPTVKAAAHSLCNLARYSCFQRVWFTLLQVVRKGRGRMKKKHVLGSLSLVMTSTNSGD